MDRPALLLLRPEGDVQGGVGPRLLPNLQQETGEIGLGASVAVDGKGERAVHGFLDSGRQHCVGLFSPARTVQLLLLLLQLLLIPHTVELVNETPARSLVDVRVGVGARPQSCPHVRGRPRNRRRKIGGTRCLLLQLLRVHGGAASPLSGAERDGSAVRLRPLPQHFLLRSRVRR